MDDKTLDILKHWQELQKELLRLNKLEADQIVF